MSSIYRRVTKRIDPKTGVTTERESKKWWGQYRDAGGTLRRKPLSTNQSLAKRMLAELVEQVELEKAGLVSPAEKEIKKPIKEHIDAFEKHQMAKENSEQYVVEIMRKVRAIADFCKWKTPSQITESDVEGFLLDLRQRQGRSIQTSNNYLRAIKNFTRWMTRNKRLLSNPLDELSMLNTRTDRRHDRRPLGDEEFTRLVHVAETGPPAVGLLGRDRSMLYILAAWTGFRRGELGSLTLRSFRLDAEMPTVTVEASYSKHRRQDVQVLHPDIVLKLKDWLVRRKPKTENEILFPVSKKTCGVDRSTSDMIQRDLGSARRFWIAETDDSEERKRREESDFLAYKNKAGLFADFHGLRHTFISNLGKAGVAPKTAQILARHSDLSLTMNIYTHVDQQEQAAAINLLPSVPGLKKPDEESGVPA